MGHASRRGGRGTGVRRRRRRWTTGTGVQLLNLGKSRTGPSVSKPIASARGRVRSLLSYCNDFGRRRKMGIFFALRQQLTVSKYQRWYQRWYQRLYQRWYQPPSQTTMPRLRAALKRPHNARTSQTKHTQPITRSHGLPDVLWITRVGLHLAEWHHFVPDMSFTRTAVTDGVV